MDYFDAISKRHSYRGPFKEQPIPRDDLQKIVEAGLVAPSGMNQQSTTFVVIDETELVETIRKMHSSNTAMQQAAAYIACIIDRDPAPVIADLSFQIEDCAAAVENMLLAVTAMGYATVWIDGWLRADNRAETIGELLNIPGNKIIRVLLPVGVPAEMHSQPKKSPFEERAWFNRYNQ